MNMPLNAAMEEERLSLRIARTFFQRLAGLLFRPRLQANEMLLIPGCNSVHMIGMRYAIDLVYLDRHGLIMKCVPRLRPFGLSICAKAWAALEMAEGTVARLRLEAGQTLPMLALLGNGQPDPREISIALSVFLGTSNAPDAPAVDVPSVAPSTTRPGVLRRQSGAAMLEFVVAAPALMLIGLGIVQYGLLFFAKNNINYATFEAARTGAVANANLDKVLGAYKKALIPLYGGGRNISELQESYDKVQQDMTGETLKVELLNPTKESFDDWNAKGLQDDKAVGNGKRVIPVLMQNFPQALNSYQMTRDPKSIGPTSGQTLADASLIKVRVVHGYEPKIPFIGKMMAYVAGYNETDQFKKQIYDAGRIPIVSHVTLQMQSNAIESTTVSSPGMGNNGSPVDPGPAEEAGNDPPCTGTFCSPQACDPATDPNCNPTPPHDLCPKETKG